MTVSLFLVPCSAYSSTTPDYTVTLNSHFFRVAPRYESLFVDTMNSDSSYLGTSTIVGHPITNTGRNSFLYGAPESVTINLTEATANIGSVLIQGRFNFTGITTNGTIQDRDASDRAEEDAIGYLAVTYSDGIQEYTELVYGTNFYVSSAVVGDYMQREIVFYASLDTSKGKQISSVALVMGSADTANGLYFGISKSWESAPTSIQIDYTNFMITFETSSGGGGTTDPDNPDDPGTGGGGSGGDDTTSQDVLDAIITLDQSIKGQTTAINNAIQSLGDRLAHVDSETAEKLLETETKRLQLEEDLSSVEDITDEYFNDLVNRFQLLGLEDWEWPASVISAFALLGGVFTQIWDSFGAYKVVYLFPMVLSIILVIVGRIARHARRTGSGATNNNDRQGEVKDT